jgi:NitT/TauT family transport system ATP-binding protein
MAALTTRGKRLVQAASGERKAMWREQILTLNLFRAIHAVLRRQEDRTVDSEFVLETIVTRMPYENHDKIFNTFVDWSRYGELFAYDEATHRITLLR